MGFQFGDSSGNLSGNQKAKSQTLVGDGLSSSTWIGDVYSLGGDSRGGNDLLIAFSGFNTFFGDAIRMEGRSVGGNDTLTATDGSNAFYGDAVEMRDRCIGGNDLLVVSGGFGQLHGDTYTMTMESRGGNDVLRAVGGSNFLYGDAVSMRNSSRGGNDLLIGGSGDSTMVGDAGSAESAFVLGGNDTLISGAGNDRMWGDFREYETGTPGFGFDIFRFGLKSGNDIIFDFQTSKDKIDLVGKGIASIAQLNMGFSDGGVLLDFADDGQITVIGVIQLVESDFIFATT